MPRFVDLPHAAARDQLQIFITADIRHRLGGQMSDLFPLLLTAFELVEIYIHAVDAAVDKTTQDLTGGLKNTGDCDRGHNYSNSRRIGLTCERAVSGL